VLAAGAVAAPLALAAVALQDEGERALVVRDRAGDELVRAELPSKGGFALAYRHSYYGAPARELFTASDGSAFRLRAIESPSAAVLDYYALAGERTRKGTWLRLVPRESRRYERLALIATKLGRRSLIAGGRRFPLYARSARHLTIAVEDAS
jgi:Domain of unknown function (DUF1850)